VCNATSTGTGGSILDSLLTPPDTNPITDTKKATSTFDLIDFFANPPSATATNIGTPVDITINSSIEDTGNASALSPTGASQTPPTAPGALSPYGPIPQQTFISSDLANSPVPTFSQSSTFQGILAYMRATLETILRYLQPFGGIRVQLEQQRFNE